jgi:hypothetical protein
LVSVVAVLLQVPLWLLLLFSDVAVPLVLVVCVVVLTVTQAPLARLSSVPVWCPSGQPQ